MRSLQIRIFLWLFLLKCKQTKISLTSHHIKQCSKSSETMIHISKNKPRLFPFPFQAPERVHTLIPVCHSFLTRTGVGYSYLTETPLPRLSSMTHKVNKGRPCYDSHHYSMVVWIIKKQCREHRPTMHTAFQQRLWQITYAHTQKKQPKLQHLNHTAETHVL